MARIRTIKPEFFTSEDIVSLSPLARLFYVALWCEADKEGRLAWKLGTLKMRYLPGDSAPIEELGAELVNAGLVELYEVDGKHYAEIPGFKRHQIINNRESESTLPPRVADATLTRESGVKAEGKEGRERKGKEGKGREGNARQDASAGEAPIPDWVPEKPWQAWIAGRVRLRKPPTAEALTLAVRELDRLRAAGHDPGAVLEQSTLNGWSGLFALKAHQARASPANQQAVTDAARRMVFGEESENAAG